MRPELDRQFENELEKLSMLAMLYGEKVDENGTPVNESDIELFERISKLHSYFPDNNRAINDAIEEDKEYPSEKKVFSFYNGIVELYKDLYQLEPTMKTTQVYHYISDGQVLQHEIIRSKISKSGSKASLTYYVIEGEDMAKEKIDDPNKVNDLVYIHIDIPIGDFVYDISFSIDNPNGKLGNPDYVIQKDSAGNPVKILWEIDGPHIRRQLRGFTEKIIEHGFLGTDYNEIGFDLNLKNTEIDAMKIVFEDFGIHI